MSVILQCTARGEVEKETFEKVNQIARLDDSEAGGLVDASFVLMVVGDERHYIGNSRWRTRTILCENGK